MTALRSYLWNGSDDDGAVDASRQSAEFGSIWEPVRHRHWSRRWSRVPRAVDTVAATMFRVGQTAVGVADHFADRLPLMMNCDTSRRLRLSGGRRVERGRVGGRATRFQRVWGAGEIATILKEPTVNCCRGDRGRGRCDSGHFGSVRFLSGCRPLSRPVPSMFSNPTASLSSRMSSRRSSSS